MEVNSTNPVVAVIVDLVDQNKDGKITGEEARGAFNWLSKILEMLPIPKGVQVGLLITIVVILVVYLVYSNFFPKNK
jgi:hypothetical protein